MPALRTIHRIENNMVNISIPQSFNTGYVEVIVLPYSGKEHIDKNLTKKETTTNDFQKLLLHGPTMTEEDLKFFEEKRNHFNLWK